MNYIVLHYFSFAYLIIVEGCQCGSQIRRVYSRPGKNVVLQFSADLTDLDTQRLFTVKLNDDPPMASIRYYAGKTTVTDAINGTTITGDLNGNVVVTLSSVQKSSAGIYKMLSSGFPDRCNCLFILGIPYKPVITANKNPSVGDTETLTCSSTSSTTPNNHGLNLTYNWRVNDSMNPNGDKYSYSSRRTQMTVKNIEKDDANKLFTCTSTEDVNNGFTSISSDSFTFDVSYGPDNVRLNPTDTNYTKKENDSLPQVTCLADCKPACNFKWTKIGQQNRETGINSNSGLNIEKLEGSDAGTYKCTATRGNASSKSIELSVNVIYGPRNILFSPRTDVYLHDENYDIPQITCSTDCWECNYSWSGPNSFSSANTVLDLSPLSRTMAGIYSCTARNTRLHPPNAQIKNLQINVRYGPDLVTLLPDKTQYIIDEGSFLNNIKCEADCFPKCTYKWRKDGQRNAISQTDILSLGQVNSSFAGKYICIATNGNDSLKVSDTHLMIKVRYGPYQSSTKLEPPNNDYTINEGDRLPNINCSAGCFPQCIYSWTKTRLGHVTQASSSGVLSLGILNPNDAATYTCTAKNSEKSSPSETKKTVTVNVRYGPDEATLNQLSPYTITEGDTNVKIQCNAGCYPGCSYKWTHLKDRSQFSSDQLLELPKVTRENAGDFECLASNTATQYKKTASSIVNIIVQYAPDVKVDLSTQEIKEGETLTLLCNGTGIPSKYNYTSLIQTWDNIDIPNPNKKLKGTKQYSSLYFSSLILDDTGTYTCSLNNGIKSASGLLNQSASERIFVQVSPKMLLEERRFTGSTGETITIQLPIYSFPHIDNVSVTRYNGQVISKDKYSLIDHVVETKFYGKPVRLNGSLILLTINNLIEDDFGNYTFKISNALNTTYTVVDIVAEGPPSQPKHLQYKSEYAIPTFVWEKEFNGGLHQYFVIQTSIADTEIWINQTDISENDNRYLINSTFYTANVTGLTPGTYSARIFAHNIKGMSSYVDLNTTFTVYQETADPSTSMPLAAIAGGSSAAILVILVTGVTLFILRRRFSNKDENRTRLNSRKGRVEDEDNDEDEVNTVNPMYVSADEVQSADNTYAQPMKKKKALEVSDVYAMVDKMKMKDRKGNKKMKENQAVDGSIYENAPSSSLNGNTNMKKVEKGKAYDENPYENPLAEEGKQPKKLVNKDGLIYADLTFNDQPKGQKKLVIHGLDSMTEYVEVDFTKKADPLPDSDEEENTTHK